MSKILTASEKYSLVKFAYENPGKIQDFLLPILKKAFDKKSYTFYRPQDIRKFHQDWMRKLSDDTERQFSLPLINAALNLHRNLHSKADDIEQHGTQAASRDRVRESEIEHYMQSWERALKKLKPSIRNRSREFQTLFAELEEKVDRASAAVDQAMLWSD